MEKNSHGLFLNFLLMLMKDATPSTPHSACIHVQFITFICFIADVTGDVAV